MRIAVVHPAFGAWGGAENLVLWLAGGLRARGHEVTVFAGAFSERAQDLFGEAGVPTQSLRHMHGRQWDRLQITVPRARLLPMADHVVRLDQRAMRRGARAVAEALSGFDAINVHNFPAHWWIHEARRAAGERFPPVLWYCNEPSRLLYPGLFEGPDFAFIPDGSELQAYDRQAGRAMDCVVGDSRYVRARIAAIYERPDAGVLYPGLPDPGPPAPYPARGSREGLEVLTVARLVPAKGVACAIEAVARVPGVRLRVAGTGPQRADLEALARERGVADRVQFLGFVPDADLPALYRSADAFLYLPVGEPFGLVVAEAAAAGVPSIASNHGGPSEIVIHDETGCLVDPRSPESVAGALRRLLGETVEGRLGMGRAARARFEQLFTLPRMVEGFEGMVGALLREGREAGTLLP